MATSSISLPTVSVLVPTSGRRDRLPKLLDSLRHEKVAEVLIVVNGPPDGSMELLESRTADDPRLKPHYLPEADLAAAQELGTRLATGDIVLWLDDDVLAAPGLAEGHARHHASRTGLVVVGYMPVDLPEPRRKGEYGIHLYSRSYEEACAGYERSPESILRGLWGGNVSVGRENLLGVGFRPPESMRSAYWYHQDLDFGLRCELAGLEAVFDRSLLARHEHRVTPEAFLRLARATGASRAMVHFAHPQLLGQLPDRFAEEGMPMTGRLLLRIARRGLARATAKRLLRSVTAVAGSLKLFRLESRAAYLMGKIEQRDGALAVWELAGEDQA